MINPDWNLENYSEYISIGDPETYVLERLDKKSTKTGRSCIYKLRKIGTSIRAGLYLVDWGDEDYVFEIGGYEFGWNSTTGKYTLISINSNAANNAYRSLAEGNHLLEGMKLTILFLTRKNLPLDSGALPIDMEAQKAAAILAKELLKEMEDFGVF